MDQVYIPKNRSDLGIGSYVILKPLETKKFVEKPYFYNIDYIEPVKLKIVREMMNIIDKIVKKYENIIITGSFLEKGFDFKDIDVIIINKNKLNLRYIKTRIRDRLGIEVHLISIDNKALMKGLSLDPLYQMMLSKCIAKKRFIYKIKHKIDYKILDLHLLKSRFLIDNFDYIDGNKKYYLVRNMIAISLHLRNKKIDKKKVDKEIKRVFNLKSIKEIKQNVLDKNVFLKKYKIVYKNTFNEIMGNIKHGTKQKKTN